MTDQPRIPTPDTMLMELLRVVQAKLGACLIRVQQYELLMKAMLAGRTVEGTVEQIEKARSKTTTEVQIKTLGMLVNEFCEDFVVSDDSDADEVQGSESTNRGLEAPWFSYRHTMQMSPERHQHTKAALIELKELRNQLVHHFLERFVLIDENSCRDAEAYLDATYATFNNHYVQLKEWAASMDKARALHASILHSQVFEDLLIDGINPDGTVDWPATGIVQALRDAEKACPKEGWTRLDLAIGWLCANHSDQTPARYQCKTWKQVLKRSNQFEVRVEVHPVSNQGLTWFRSRARA
jgi:hypothetical protein